MTEILIWRTSSVGKTWREAADEFARDWPIEGPRQRSHLRRYIGHFTLDGDPHRYRMEKREDTFRVWRSPA